MGRATQWLEKHSASGDAMASGTGRASMWLKEHRESSAAMTAPAVKTKAKAPATAQKHISRPTEQAPAATEPPAVTARAAPPVNPDYAPLAEVQKSQRPMAKKNPVEARSSSEKWEAPAPGEKVLKARPSAVQKATIKRVDLVVRPHKEEPIPVGPASQNRPSGGEIMIPRRPENNVQDDYASLRELGRSYYMPGVGRTINRGQGAEQRAWNTVSGAAKLSAGGIAGLGGLIAENLEALDRMAARSTTNGQRAIQEEENIRRYRSMLENGTWADGKPLSTEDRYQVLGYIQDAQDFIKLNNDYLDNIHAPIRQVQEAAYDTAGRWTESGQRDVDMAKEDLGDLGEFAVDVGVAGTQMGLDFAPAILTGGSALVPMFLRSAGGAALAGKDSGADLGTRTAYALGSGALSVLTEQISNAPDFLKGMYGEGLAERIFSHMAARYGQSAAVRAAARLASSPGGHVALAAFGEGLEELAESFFQVPLQQATIDPDAQFDPAEAGYEFLVGGTLGGLGGGVGVLAGGGIEAQLRQIREAEAPEKIQGTDLNPALIEVPEQDIADLAQQLQEQIQRQEAESQLLKTLRQIREAGTPAEFTAPVRQLQEQRKTARKMGTAASIVNYNPLEAAAIRKEGKTYRNLVAGFDAKVSEFFSKWKWGRNHVQGEKLEKLYLGQISDDMRRQISDILGYEVGKRDVIVTNDDVRHIFEEHGDAKAEISRGNIPLGDWAFDALPDVVTNPDSISKGDIKVGGKHPGKTSIIFRKSLAGGTVITIQFDNKGRGTLEITTMFANKNSGKPTQALDVEDSSP